LEREEPVALHSARQLESLCYSRGRSSAAIVRADPSLVSEMQIGAWFEAGWRGRLARRALRRIPRLASCLRALLPGPGSLRMAADAWFWAGVRRGTSAQEWRRLTRSSYVVLCYHRLAGKGKESERELDIAPGQFERQMRALRLLRFHPLSPSELLAFHSDPAAVLPRRRFVVTADDAYLDAVACLERNARLQPQVFALTALVDGAPRPPDQASRRAGGARPGRAERRDRRLAARPRALATPGHPGAGLSIRPLRRGGARGDDRGRIPGRVHDQRRSQRSRQRPLVPTPNQHPIPQ
jgi:hypothetical protein